MATLNVLSRCGFQCFPSFLKVVFQVTSDHVHIQCFIYIEFRCMQANGRKLSAARSWQVWKRMAAAHYSDVTLGLMRTTRHLSSIFAHSQLFKFFQCVQWNSLQQILGFQLLTTLHEFPEEKQMLIHCTIEKELKQVWKVWRHVARRYRDTLLSETSAARPIPTRLPCSQQYTLEYLSFFSDKPKIVFVSKRLPFGMGVSNLKCCFIISWQ